MVGNYDKTKISVARWETATNAVARKSYTTIGPKDQDLFCADHDFLTIEKITPTVHAYPNPQKYLTDSLYIGEEKGSRLRVGLHSVTICKSDVFQHNYAILNKIVDKVNEIIENKMQTSIYMSSLFMEGFTGSNSMPMVTIFQADCGPDQNMTFLHTRIAALDFFSLLGSDHSILFRECSGDSYRLFRENTMYLLSIPVSNCSFALDHSDLNEDEVQFVKKIMKVTGNMTDTQEAITDFNHQFLIAIWVKKQIQERSTVVSTSSSIQATGEDTVTGDNSTIEYATLSNSQAIVEETVAGDDAQPPI